MAKPPISEYAAHPEDVAALMAKLKKDATAEDASRKAAIEAMSPEEQKEFLGMPEGEQAAKTPEKTALVRPDRNDPKYEKADGTFNLRLYQADELAYNRAKIRAAGSPATAER